jgi:hypothetical protein
MKKLLTFILASITILTLTSCEVYAQPGIIEDGIVYEYSYNNYPVRYINGLPYYYNYYNNVWTWVVLPEIYRPHIVHHRPFRYNTPYHRNVRPIPHHIPHHQPHGTIRSHPTTRGNFNHSQHRPGHSPGSRGR